MAVGPIARLLAQVIVPVIAIVARAIPAAYAQALQNARKSGTAASATAATDLFRTTTKQMSKSEALQILNISESDLDTVKQQQSSSSASASSEQSTIRPNIIEEQYNKYMNANMVKRIPNSSYNTGSFYLQSKIHYAKETLLQELMKEQQEKQQQKQQQQNEQSSSSQ